MQILSRRKALVAAAVALTAAGTVAFAGGSGSQDPTGGPRTGQSSQIQDPQAFFRSFTVPFATGRSDIASHTVLNVTNDSDVSVDVYVEWRFSLGGIFFNSPVFTLPPHTGQRFVTSDSAESLQPFLTAGWVFIPGGSFFLGSAYVYTGPNSGSGRNVTVGACLLAGIGNEANGNAHSVSELKVLRTKDVNGTFMSRQKGD